MAYDKRVSLNGMKLTKRSVKIKCFKSWSIGHLGTTTRNSGDFVSPVSFVLLENEAGQLYSCKSCALRSCGHISVATSVLRSFTLPTFRHSMHYDVVIMLQITATKRASSQGYGTLPVSTTKTVLPTKCCGTEFYTTWPCFLFQLLWHFQRLLFSSATGKG